ncbi:GNAT family N-acetyltransferase [Roseibium sp. SCP14]|uniref:GNAT family N-acetyltransferase n=1 Tax=Roseibium sp. SCP14 TaxID=3141375 RepID=UPI003339C4A6
MTTLDVRTLEEVALNAWPALQTVSVGGWVFRISGGCTKRSNSVNALAPWSKFEEIVCEAESFYARCDLPPIFRLSPLAPPECDALLQDRGYTFFDQSLVLLAPIENARLPEQIEIRKSPSSDWLSSVADANQISVDLRPVHEEIVHAIKMPAAFATVYQNGTAVGFGLAVRERGMVGLFDIVVSPRARGKGHGRAVTQALMNWGQAGGATQAYLQVHAQNSVARSLYASLGFEEVYSYHYRLPPKR